MPFGETDRRNNREFWITTETRKSDFIRMWKGDSAHFEISSSVAHAEVDYKKEIRNMLFDREDSLLKVMIGQR